MKKVLVYYGTYDKDECVKAIEKEVSKIEGTRKSILITIEEVEQLEY